jgi:peptidoglycan/LPS O-acetylase OafA/YrhL
VAISTQLKSWTSRSVLIASTTSIFLDSLRIAAALAVYLSHCAQFWSSDAYQVLSPVAFGAVVVFFVLSGYVIAASTLSRGITLQRYSVSRLSRLYSTVLPALLLGVALDLAGRYLNPQFYAYYSRGHDVLRYALAGLFLQNVWWLSASPPTNPPLWSLCYEFWYYAIFGSVIFVRGYARRAVVVAILAFIAGPNVLLLMPCWLIGVLAFLSAGRLGRATGSGPFYMGALACFLLFLYVVPASPHSLGTPPLYFSAAFVSDWVLALAVGLLIAGFDSTARLSPAASPSTRAPVTWVRSIADHTFPLYLYHFPLLAFVTATLHLAGLNLPQALAMSTALLIVILMLSWATESQRNLWKRILRWIWQGLAGYFQRTPA